MTSLKGWGNFIKERGARMSCCKQDKDAGAAKGNPDLSGMGALTPVGVDAVLAERGDRYGKFINNATVAQDIKIAMQCDTNFHELSADKREALDQIASKISRIVTANASEYKDSWTDICGYAKLVADTLED